MPNLKSKLNVEKFGNHPNITVVMKIVKMVLQLNELHSKLVENVIKKHLMVFLIEVVQIIANGRAYFGELLYNKTSLVDNIEHTYLSIPAIERSLHRLLK